MKKTKRRRTEEDLGLDPNPNPTVRGENKFRCMIYFWNHGGASLFPWHFLINILEINEGVGYMCIYSRSKVCTLTYMYVVSSRLSDCNTFDCCI